MNFNDIKEIKTKRLLLRPINDSDAERMTAMFSSEEIATTYMMPDFKSDEEKKKLFLRFKELSISSDRFVRGIYLDGIMIGFMNNVDISDGHIELGYVINPEYKSNGYATEALSAATDALFSIGFSSVRCGAFSENTASIRVMEKAGMVREDLTEDIEYRGIMHRCVYYSINAPGTL